MYVFEGDIQVKKNGVIGTFAPSAWSTLYRALELGQAGNSVFGNAAGSQLLFTTNAYWTGTNWKYAVSSQLATYLECASDGAWNFNNAPSGTAGNTITFTQRMRIAPTGHVGLNVYPDASARAGSLTLGVAGSGVAGYSGGTDLLGNLYYDGTNWKYGVTNYAALIQAGASSAGIYVYGAPSGTAGTNVTLTQILQVTKGYAVALEGASVQAGTGITFPATQSASTNANTLDDYEEGTWTPSSGTANVTCTEQAAAVYNKIGRVVTASCYLAVANNTGGNINGFTLNGLPFTHGGSNYGSGNVYYNPTAFTPFTSCYVQAGTSYALIAWAAPAQATGTTKYLMICFVYQV